MKVSAILFALTISLTSYSQDNPAYKVFTGEGKKADYGDIIKASLKSDVVFFGELHDDAMAHWLELEITRSLYEKAGKNLILAAEMFETDNQLNIDEYLNGTIKETSFEAEVKKWKNYATDYKPLMSFAKDSGLYFIASNIPRRYASLVASSGFEGLNKLSPDALKFIAPLPVEYDPELACYKDMLSMGGAIGGPMGGKVSPNLPKAQAIKDATMASSILKYWTKGKIVIHYNGSYHSDRYMGIIWYLNKYNPAVTVTTIATVTQNNIDKLDDESKNSADFIIAIPSTMTKTYR